MCGIAGFALRSGAAAPDLAAMLAPLRRRGPDDSGSVRVGNVGLAAARLAIVGGEAGAQPLRHARGDLLVFNGELYDWRGRASQLGLATVSDAAVVLELLVTKGVAALDGLRGPFALAWHDVEQDRVVLARDRFGQRPLYWSEGREGVRFASSVAALLAAGVEARVDEEGLRDLLTLQFYRPDRTLFAGIRSVAPGERLEIRAGRATRHRPARRTWALATAEAPTPERLRHALDEAVALQRPAERDGLFLSGGLDSSALAAAARHAGRPFARAWVGAFAHGSVPDERAWARLAAGSDTPLDEILVDENAWMQALEEVVEALEMPMAGPGTVAQLLLCRRAAEDVRVVFAGQGGDELFGGYERLRILQSMAQGRVVHAPGYGPLAARMQAAAREGGLEGAWRAALDRGRALDQGPPTALTELRRGGLRRERFVDAGKLDQDAERGRLDPDVERLRLDGCERHVRFELDVLLPGLLLADDRIAGHHGLETRLPFLDPPFADLVEQLPLAAKSPPQAPRLLFHRAFDALAPDVISARRDKVGFAVPLRAWLDGGLGERVRERLLDRGALDRGLWTEALIHRLLADDGAGGRLIFSLLMLELWHRRFSPASAPA